MAERGQAYQPFMQVLQERIMQIMEQAKSGAVPESLRSLPKVERPAFKRKARKPSKTTRYQRNSAQ
jgi:DNA topoisomerase-3